MVCHLCDGFLCDVHREAWVGCVVRTVPVPGCCEILAHEFALMPNYQAFGFGAAVKDRPHQELLCG